MTSNPQMPGRAGTSFTNIIYTKLSTFPSMEISGICIPFFFNFRSVENVDRHSKTKTKNLISCDVKRFFIPLRYVQNDSFCGFSTEH